MSDEEKESIEWLKRLVKINKRDNLDDTFAEILLNLIEKQQKEIEELKNADLTTVYISGIYDGEKKWQDKIKAKIEEQYDKKSKARLELIPLYRYAIAVLQSLIEKE